MFKDLKQIYLIRHGATQENNAGILIGQIDPPLSEDSKCQIKQLKFPREPAAIYSSPLRRAAETACLLFSDKSVTLDSDLKERGFGDFEGKPFADLTLNIDGRETYAFRDEETLVKNNGEPLNILESRILRFKRTLMNTDADVIAVVSHGTLISHMIRVFFAEESRRHSPGNLNVVYFTLDENGSVSGLRYNIPILEL